MNQDLQDIRGLFTFTGQDELDAKQEAFSNLDHSAQIFALGVLLVATLDAVYLVGQTLDPEPDTTPEPQTDAPPAPPAPPRRLALSSSTSSPAAPASEASTSSPAAPASETSTSSPAAPASAPFEVS